MKITGWRKMIWTALAAGSIAGCSDAASEETPDTQVDAEVEEAVEEQTAAAADSADTKEAGGVVGVTDIPEAVEQVSFEVKLPQEFPFEVDGSFGQVKDIAESEMLEATYVNQESRQFMVFEVSDVDWELESDYQKVELPNGETGGYLDNGAVQTLQWEQDGLSYFIRMGIDEEAESHVFSADELVSIAEDSWFEHWE